MGRTTMQTMTQAIQEIEAKTSAEFDSRNHSVEGSWRAAQMKWWSDDCDAPTGELSIAVEAFRKAGCDQITVYVFRNTGNVAIEGHDSQNYSSDEVRFKDLE